MFNEVKFVDGIEDDFLRYKLTNEEVLSIKAKLLLNNSRILKLSQRVNELSKDIRKIRFGDYRLFFILKNTTFYCLAYYNRRESYKTKFLKRVLIRSSKLF